MERLGKNGEPRRDAGDVELVTSLFDQQFAAARLRRWQKNAIWRIGDIFPGAKYADVRFDFVVIGRKALVGDGPILAQAVARLGLEINRGKTQRDASPVVCAASDDARAEPLEIGSWGGGVGLSFDSPGAIGRKELAEIIRGFPANANATVWQFVGPHEHLEVFFGIQRRPCLQQYNAQATFRQKFCGHTAACAGTDNADVISLGSAHHLGHQRSS